MNTTYLLLGSNAGKSRQMLVDAEKNIAEQIGAIKKRSAVYLTAAWGNSDQPDFLNRVLFVETTLTAAETLEKTLRTETEMGRVRSFKNAPRTIDIDILFFNDDIIDMPGLKIPHPEIRNRRFTLELLADISPALVHPVFHKTIARLLAECSDTLNVQKI